MKHLIFFLVYTSCFVLGSLNAATKYVSKSGNGTAPYDTLETAATNILDAVNASVDGDEIIVSPGVYSEATTISITNAIKVISSAPRAALINRNSANATAVQVNNAEAILDGFTISNINKVALIVNAGCVTNCYFYKNVPDTNTAAREGVFQVKGGSIVDSLFVGNSQKCENFAYCKGLINITEGLVDRCVITNNTYGNCDSKSAYDTRGYVNLTTSAAIIRNSLIAGNTPKRIPVLMSVGGSVENCTIVNNSVVQYSSHPSTLAAVRAGANSIFVNTIISGNKVHGAVSELAVVDTSATVNNCLVVYKGELPGEDNITDLRPIFAGGSNETKYQILPSATVDAGKTLDWMTGALDLVGNQRNVSTRPDIGCYEFQSNPLECYIYEQDDLYEFKNLTFTFSAESLGLAQTGVVFEWTLSGDVNESQSSETFTRTLGPGQYFLELKATNGRGDVAIAPTKRMITICDETVYVSKNGTSKPPYLTEETAAKTINEAIGVASDGATVLVSPGVYSEATTISITNTIKVISSVPRATLINRNSANATAVQVNNPEAILDGFTISNINKVALIVNAGCVTNCYFYKNVPDTNTAAREGVFQVKGGSIVDSLFVGNSQKCENFAYCKGLINITEGLVDRCVITNNTYGNCDSKSAYDTRGYVNLTTSAAIIRNSLIAGNTPKRIPVLMSVGGSVENCTIVNNSVVQNGSFASTPAAVRAGANSIFVNTIISGNKVHGAVSELAMVDTSVTFNNCLVETEVELIGTKNVTDSQPIFVQQGGFDWALSRESPGVNDGMTLPWMNGARDVLGNPRKISRPDMGCAESPWTAGFSVIIR